MLQDSDTKKMSGYDGEYNGVDHRLINNYISRFIFDNIFKIILVLIVINMVAGI